MEFELGKGQLAVEFLEVVPDQHCVVSRAGTGVDLEAVLPAGHRSLSIHLRCRNELTFMSVSSESVLAPVHAGFSFSLPRGDDGRYKIIPH